MTVPPEETEREGPDDTALAKERRRIRVLADLWAAHSQVTAPQDGPLVITQMVAELFALAENLFVEIERRAPAAPASGEAPKLTAEQVRQADEIATGMIRHPIKPDYYRRMADALNGVLGSAPQKEVK